jgi:hypothetical protein
MLKDNTRLCDVCDDVIPKGEKYRVSIIPKGKAHLFSDDPDLIPTTNVDSQGNIRLDICLECHLNMGAKGIETVN